MSRLLTLAQGDSMWLPPEASTSATSVDEALSFVFWISAFFFVLIVGLMVLFVLRYRQRKAGDRGTGSSQHLGIELVWTGIPILVVAAIFWVGFTKFLDLVTPPENTYDIQVNAQKWSWLFRYPNGWVDNELHVPVDTPVKLLMRSEDVIHSFYVPAFRVKMDVVPGRINRTWFEATRPGEYPLLCTEYCGTGHSDMITKVVVHEPGGFEKWLKNAASLLSPAFTAAQVQDAQALLNRVKNGDRPIDVFVRENLTDAANTGIQGWAAGSTIPDELTTAVLESLNEIMKTDPAIYTEERFAGVNVFDETRELAGEEGLAGEDLLFANRYLLAEAYPDALQKRLDFVSAGKQLYGGKGGCKQCHSIDGTMGTGPTFLDSFGARHEMRDGSTVTVDEEYIRESIVNPKAKVRAGYQAVMPSYDGRLKPREIDALIEYIKTLSSE